jgi:hypothetical protein
MVLAGPDGYNEQERKENAHSGAARRDDREGFHRVHVHGGVPHGRFRTSDNAPCHIITAPAVRAMTIAASTPIRTPSQKRLFMG